MPPIEQADLRQTAVRFKLEGRDRHGRAALSEPEEFSPGSPCGGVRWVAGRSSTLSPENEVIGTDVTLITKTRVYVGDLFRLGPISDLPSGTADPDELYEVVSANATPSIKANLWRHEAKLRKYGDALPTPDE